MKISQVIYRKRDDTDSHPEYQYSFKRQSKIYADIPHETIREVQRSVHEQHTKNIIEETEKLKKLTINSQHILLKCSTVFPFDLFPDEISIEPTQINIRIKSFFLTNHLITIPIKNITDVHVQTSLFFASLTFIDRSFVENTITINWLKKRDAIIVRKIVQGLITATSQKINVDQIEPAVLREQTELLGNMHRIDEQ